MSHEFEVALEVDLPATPEQVWDAIATGPGLDAWFMGRNEIEPREGGQTRMAMPGFTAEATVTAFEPPHRFAIRGTPAEDGSFMAFEYIVEGREGGSAVLRFVHSGILGGDFDAEYDALKKGDPLYLRSLAQYLEHFAGRTAVPVTAFGPQQPDEDQAWAAITRAVGLTAPVSEGDKAHFTVADQEVIGVVDTVLAPTFLGVRTENALLRFVGGRGMILTGHHLYAKVDPDEAQTAWSGWLSSVFA